MKRREFVTLLGGAAASWPLAARAQQPTKVAQIGFLDFGPASARASRVEALQGGLRDLGYVEGENIVFRFRWVESVEQLPELAAQLVRMKVDVILAMSSTMGARFFARVMQDEVATCALEIIIARRNNLAHGKQSLPLVEIKKHVTKGLRLESWGRIPETDGEFQVVDWQPWARASSTTIGQIGLLERWEKNALRYLVPETGEIFKVPRSSWGRRTSPRRGAKRLRGPTSPSK